LVEAFLCHRSHDTLKVYDWCMRTNIVIDDRLLSRARKLTRLRTKREIVTRALELLVETEARKAILRYRGAGIWEGDLKAMRRSRV
jgi:Arc/MetJ family transcription regulator